MKIFLSVAVAAFLLSSMLAADPAKEKPPTVSAEVEISKYVSATECYVLFLLECSGETMTSAKAKFEQKLKAFTELVRKDFPNAKRDVISVNAGTRDFSEYRTSEKAFSPNIAKVLLFTLPPNEDMALKLLDLGVKSGVTPFCGTSRNGTFGAVFYGLKNVKTEMDQLHSLAVQELKAQANRLAIELDSKIVRMSDISRYIPPRGNPYELNYKDIKVLLPNEFCASDKDRIKVSLLLRAEFIIGKKSEK